MNTLTPEAVVTRAASDRDHRFLEETFLSALRDAITAARGAWDEIRERRQFQEQLRLEHARIVEWAGEDVGFVVLIPRPEDLLVGTLCIAPGYQCRGIGARVMGEIICSAQAQGLALVLNVLKSNSRALRFYEGLGFIVVGESTYHHQLRYEAREALHQPR